MSEAGGSVAGAAGTIVGILGVGAMARRLLNKGYRVVVRDIVAERGACRERRRGGGTSHQRIHRRGRLKTD